MKRVGPWAALLLIAASCESDVNDDDVRIAVTSRVALSSTGEAPNQGCEEPAVSADGRWLVFVSEATNLTSVATNGVAQVYVRDLVTGAVEIVSVNDAGQAAAAPATAPSISADGQRVAFQSEAGNLVPGDFAPGDVFVRRRDLGTTIRVSEADGGGDADDDSSEPMISGNGLFVVFTSEATNLIGAGTGGIPHVFRRDLEAGVTELVSVDPLGDEGDLRSEQATVSFDGDRVAFASQATTLTADADIPGTYDIFVREMTGGTTVRISFADNPLQAPDGHSVWPCISGDGSTVAFLSEASNLVPADSNGILGDVFVRAVAGGPILLASRHSLGTPGSSASGRPAISHSGSRLAFYSNAPNLVDGDSNDRIDAFWRDLESGRTVRLSVSTAGVGGTLESGDVNERPALTGDGRFGYFKSRASDLIGQDINGKIDIFRRGPLY